MVLSKHYYYLTLIKNYKEILNPSSTGELEVSFWKSKENVYFTRIQGGCFAYEDKLYGPFKLKNGQFIKVVK